MKFAQSCLTLCNPLHSMEFSFLSPGAFPNQGLNPGLLHCWRILYQLRHKWNPRTLKWVAYPFSSWSSWPRNWTGVSCIAGGFFTNWAMREALKFWTLFWILHFVHVLHPSFLTFDIIRKSFVSYWKTGTSLVAQLVKNPPAMQETQVLSLSREDPLEKGMATHSSILAWRIPWTVAFQAPLSTESQSRTRLRD